MILAGNLMNLDLRSKNDSPENHIYMAFALPAKSRIQG